MDLKKFESIFLFAEISLALPARLRRLPPWDLLHRRRRQRLLYRLLLLRRLRRLRRAELQNSKPRLREFRCWLQARAYQVRLCR